MPEHSVLSFIRKNLKWIAALLCLFLFFAIAEDLMENELNHLDAVGYRWVSMLRCDGMTAFFKLVTNLAHPIALITVSLLLVIFCIKKSYRIAVYGNLILNLFLNLSLKALFLRGRPADVAHLINETGYSFPSGHAMAATAFYGFMIFLLWHGGQPKWRKWAGTGGLAAVILTVCLSRIYLGVHYTSDVLAGCAVSCAYLIVFTSVVKRYLDRGQGEELEKNTAKKSEGLGASFLHAFDGLRESVKTERNLLIHFSIMALVLVFGALLKISITEWLVCVVCFGLVISMELINTALEATVDICSPEVNPKAKLAKDAAAGAVLASAMASAAAGCVIFLPKLWTLFLEVIH
jgi:undecaprenyl-diphosphatase